MSNPQFGFLPWMRKGIAAHILQPDDAASPTAERAMVQVDVKLTYASTTTVSNNVQLVGPGDIINVAPENVVRTEPVNGSYNFEDNYLPYIEFYEEDFLWRYTPAVPAANDHLRPWLALIILSDNEFTMNPPAADGYPASITLTVDPATVLHAHKEHWAWAHVHVNKPNNSPGSYIDGLKQDLSTNPDVAVSRLLSSRRLSPQTQYTAFLIPAFETGRLAGLNKPAATISATSSLAPSWYNPLPSGQTNPTQYPVYFEWRFGTAALGDFESLARALKPRSMDPSLGGRVMDVSRSGMGLDAFINPPTVPATVVMEGALKPTSFTPLTPKNAGSTDNYTTHLKEILNLPVTIKDPLYSGSYSGFNPYSGSTVNIDQDPVVTPPIYGQWHANVKKVDGTNPVWLQQMNLDPRYRAAAGIGAEVVRRNKQRYMEAAWNEIGEVLLVNDKINKARIALEASKNVYTKHLIGDASMAATSDLDKMHDFTKIASLAFKRFTVSSVGVSGGSGPYLTGVTSFTGVTATRSAYLSKMTDATTSGAFRKATRNRSAAVAQKGAGYVNARLVSHLNDGTTATVNVFADPEGTTPTSTFVNSATTANNSSASSPFATANVTSWAQVYHSTTSPVVVSGFNAFAFLISYYNPRKSSYEVVRAKLDVASFISNVKTALDPAIAITDRVLKQVDIQASGSPISIALNAVMAYPVIDDPMFNELTKLSYEYLLPNLGQYPNNIVTILETNNRFIESYMAGLNHEFAKELLWQEYPTDQRGSYFRRFWDINDTVNYNTANPNFMYDIAPMHQWAGALGENNQYTRHNPNPASPPASFLVLLIRGDLLKKYPNTLMYMQQASPTPTTAPHALGSAAIDSYGNPNPATVRMPLFKATLQPDIVMLGFDLTKQDVLGNSTYPGGWFFVVRERPGQLRFGLEEPGSTSVSAMHSWHDANWAFMGSSPQNVSVANGIANGLGGYTDPLNSAIQWSNTMSSATMAWILYRNPVMVAIHAESMIY